MHDIVIELDSDETVAARSGGSRSFRRWAVLASAAFVLLSTSGPVGPPGPAGVILVSVLADPTGGQGIRALAEDVFLVEEPGGVAAYELNGRKRWSAHAQHPATRQEIRQDLIGVLGDLVVISSHAGELGSVITAFDAATGAQRWRLEGRLLQMREMRGMRGMRGMRDDLIAVVHDDQILRVYDVEPLRLRWEISDVTAAAVDYQTRSVVALFTDATITKLDLDSGTKRMSSRITRAVGRNVSIFLESGLVSIYASWTPTGPLETQLLSAESLLPAEPKATRADSAADSALDSAARTPQPSASPAATAMLLYDSNQQIVALADPLADPQTGTRWVDLTGWTPLPQQDGSATAPVTLLTLLAQPVQGNRTVIARVQGHRLQVLGTLPFEIDRCIYHTPILVCTVPQQRLAIWRIAPGR
ncbi:MAG TPA: PQQ-binding-like beta-propeller repeat protein [Candidatus Limnocylindrales bacterium]|nr:PQQ-binding-like beta-propeller repeat protein [Candidatus Limnocylindrales bacterium]